MTRFHDGPAKGQDLDLARSPLFLRVTLVAVGPGAGTWDALDRVDDTPRPCEAVFVYRRVGDPIRGMLDYRDAKTGRRKGRPFVMAEYAMHSPQPDATQKTDTAAWQAWCLAQSSRFPT